MLNRYFTLLAKPCTLIHFLALLNQRIKGKGNDEASDRHKTDSILSHRNVSAYAAMFTIYINFMTSGFSAHREFVHMQNAHAGHLL